MKKTLKITLILTLLATTASGQGTSFGTPNTATISSIDSVMTDSVKTDSVRVDSVAWSIKNNLVYDATLTLNIGVEAVTGRHTSLQLFYGLHPWTFSDNKKLRHWSLMSEWRRWLEEEGPMEGWFWGVHLLGGEYNAGGKRLPLGLLKPLRRHRYEGWYVGGGLSLGHAWRLSHRWRLEAAIGFGYIYTRYHQYGYERCGPDLGPASYNYVGPTKLALNVGYVIRHKKSNQ